MKIITRDRLFERVVAIEAGVFQKIKDEVDIETIKKIREEVRDFTINEIRNGVRSGVRKDMI